MLSSAEVEKEEKFLICKLQVINRIGFISGNQDGLTGEETDQQLLASSRR